MTRKDYQLIASVINSNVSLNAQAQPAQFRSGLVTGSARLARDLADKLQADNPRFDKARFLSACGL